MRIGFITGEYPPMQGGIGAHCRVLGQTLIAQGHDVSIFTDERAAEPDTRLQLTHRPIPRWRGQTMRMVNQWASDNRLDVINLHYQTAAYQMSPWIHFIDRYLTTAPLVTTFHDLRFPYLFPKAGALRTYVVRRLTNRSHGVIATNHEDYSQLTHLPHHALIPIGSSVSTDLPSDFDRNAWRMAHGLPTDKWLVAHFGFINHSKGVDTLLEAVASLHHAGMPLHLAMIGGRTGSSDPTNVAYADTIDALVDSLNIAEIVTWTGFVDDSDASAYFAASDMIALPFRDGVSYRRSSLMAAIAHQRPILTTRPSVDIPTFVNDDNLLLVAPDNPNALAAAIQTMSKSPDLVARLQRGVADLAQVFAWERIAAQNVTFFEQVIKASRKQQAAQ